MSSARFEVSLSVTENGKRAPEYTLNTDLNGEISLQSLLEWTRSALTVTADTVLKEEQARGFDRKPIVVVDGRLNKPVANVNPLGQIEFISRGNVTEILKFIYDSIYKRSPVLTGRYKSSNFVFLNGKQVATDMVTFEAWVNSNPSFKSNDLIRFVNIQPYGRKLERLGVTAQRQQSRTVRTRSRNRQKLGGRVLAPNGTYYLTSRSAKSKFKNNISIVFDFISGATLNIAGSFKNPGRRGKNSAGRPYLYPTIIVRVTEGGTIR